MKLRHRWCRIALSLLFILTLTLPVPTRADGGPIIRDDPELWVSLEEGKQIAVVRLGETEDTAQVDLFVSLLDASGESHEIAFFIPLGNVPTAFDVVEKNSRDFEAGQTKVLDNRLADAARRERNYRSEVGGALATGVFLTEGSSVFGPVFFLVFIVGPPQTVEFHTLGGEMPAEMPVEAPTPVATFWTEHSLVELYDVDADTNLEVLAATTGLDPAVQETLRRFEGQQIAVVTMQTQPASAGGGETSGYPSTTGQQGLHLAWTTRLSPGDEGRTYAYPLGTGSAWAHPIELTHIYVVAPPRVDFRVAYPRLGEHRSGYTTYTDHFYGLSFEPLIMQHTDTPGYAVDQAVGDFGRVWRATYVQSNAAEDIVVTRVGGLLPETRAALHSLVVRQQVVRYTWVVGLLAVLSIRVIAWHFVLSRYLGFPYHRLALKRWGHAVGWALIYVGSNIAMWLVVMFIITTLPDVWCLTAICLPPFALPLLCIFSGYRFALIARRRLDIPREKAIKAYALAVIASNVGYGLFALIYLALVGAL